MSIDEAKLLEDLGTVADELESSNLEWNEIVVRRAIALIGRLATNNGRLKAEQEKPRMDPPVQAITVVAYAIRDAARKARDTGLQNDDDELDSLIKLFNLPEDQLYAKAVEFFDRPAMAAQRTKRGRLLSIYGKYVSTFSEASHALPDGMHMNADYPFMLPRILQLEGREVVLKGRDEEGRFAIKKGKNGREYCIIVQSSAFEIAFGRPPMKFKAYPFKDKGTPAVSEGREG